MHSKLEDFTTLDVLFGYLLTFIKDYTATYYGLGGLLLNVFTKIF